MSKISLTFTLLATCVLLVSCDGLERDVSGGSTEQQADMPVAPTAWTVADVPVASGVVMVNRYPRAEVEFPGGVVGLPDLVYSQVNGYRQLRLDNEALRAEVADAALMLDVLQP